MRAYLLYAHADVGQAAFAGAVMTLWASGAVGVDGGVCVVCCRRNCFECNVVKFQIVLSFFCCIIVDGARVRRQVVHGQRW